MATPQKTSAETLEEMQLKARLQTVSEEIKSMLKKSRQDMEPLWKIEKERRQIEDRLQQLEAETVERDQKQRHEAQKERAKEADELRADLKALKIENEQLKQQVENLSKHGSNKNLPDPGLASETTELELLRRKYSEQEQYLEKLKENLCHTTRYSKAQLREKKEKEKQIEILTARVVRVEDENAELKLQNQNEPPLEAEWQEKLEVLRTENEQLKADRAASMRKLHLSRCQSESLVELKENLHRITSLSRTQQKTIRCLEDKISAVEQIASETQLRQLDELPSLTEENERLHQMLSTLSRQHQQQPAAEQQLPGTIRYDTMNEYLTCALKC